MQSLLRIAWRNVRRYSRRSSATILSITVGFLAIMLFQGYMSELWERFADGYPRRGMLGDLIVEKEGARSADARDFPEKYQLSDQDQRLLEEFLEVHHNEIFARVRFLPISGMVRLGRSQAIFAGYGYDVRDGRLVRGDGWAWNTVTGAPLPDKGDEQVVLGRILGNILDCKNNPPPEYRYLDGRYKPEFRPFECPKKDVQLAVNTLNGQINALNASVSGFTDMAFREVDARFIGMPLPFAQSLLDTKNVAYYTLKLAGSPEKIAFATKMQETLASKGLKITVDPWQTHEFGRFYRQGTSILKLFQNFLMVVVCLVALLSVANTVIKNVSERSREIGTLRSCGFLERQIALLFAAESVFLALVSMAAGLVILSLIIFGVNSLNLTYLPGLVSEPVPFRLGFDSRFCLIAAFSLSIATFISGLLPAWRAAKKSIPELLAST